MTLLAFTAGIPLSGMTAAGQTAPLTSQGIEEQGKRSPTTLKMPMYQPPKRGAPGGRVGGGTRGPADDLPTLAVLAPDHMGLTTQEQPIVYWYLSKPTTLPIELAIIRSLGVQPLSPLLEKRLPAPAQPGIQAIRLADLGVKLVPGEQYQWFITLVVKADRRSKDIVAGGFIERAGPPEAIQAKLDQAGKESAAYVYAETGLWYDAVMALSDMIEAAPNNSLLRKQRAALMQQVGLPEIAKYDLKHATAN
jgi:hypothetical protein